MRYSAILRDTPIFSNPPASGRARLKQPRDKQLDLIGAALAVALGDSLTWLLVAAGVLMAVGVWLHLTEHHHRHERLTHSHRHIQDEHHQHGHPEPIPAGTWHSHEHTHQPTAHSHAHYPDSHHRHDH